MRGVRPAITALLLACCVLAVSASCGTAPSHQPVPQSPAATTDGQANRSPRPSISGGDVPASAPAREPGGGPSVRLVAGVVLVLGLGTAVGIPLVRRRTSGTPFRGWAGQPPRAWSGHAVSSGQAVRERAVPTNASEPAVLREALRKVAEKSPSQAVSQQIDRLLADGDPGREALVRACVRYRDQLADRYPALAAELLESLRAAGIREILPDGLRFDARVHEAVDMVPTGDPSLDGTIAATEACGYADGERLVRAAKVTVYRLDRR